MSLHRRISRVGGSVAIIIPRDVAEAMGVCEGSSVCITLVGRQMVVEPDDDTADDKSFRRAYAAVLRRYKSTFEDLAEHDR